MGIIAHPIVKPIIASRSQRAIVQRNKTIQSG
jgi:hypothetical protein